IDTGDQKPVLYVDYGKIWKKCQKMGVSYPEFQKICVNMLWETHKRKVSTASPIDGTVDELLWETHKRKVSTAKFNSPLHRKFVVGDP
ncbi:MAG: hypothetical protein ACK5OW_01305, partial [bacterium]